MAIYFIDPGYGKNWSVVGDTGTISRVESEEYNPYCGVAFTGLKSQGAEFCALSFNSTIYMYISTSTTNPCSRSAFGFKFSVYLDLSPTEYFCAGFTSKANPTEKSHYVKFDADGYTTAVLSTDANTYETRHEGSTKGFHNVILVVSMLTRRSGTNPYQRSIHFYIDNLHDGRGASSALASDVTIPNQNVFLHFCTEKANACYVSNILTSYNSELLSEEVTGNLLPELYPETLLVRLPLKDTAGDFITGENGEYIGNTAGQQLLSTIDAQSVIEKVGATSKVSHLISYGNPGYTTSSNITTAYGRFEVGGEIVDGTGRSITTDPDATICDIKEMTDTTLADVDGKKIGWRV